MVRAPHLGRWKIVTPTQELWKWRWAWEITAVNWDVKINTGKILDKTPPMKTARQWKKPPELSDWLWKALQEWRLSKWTPWLPADKNAKWKKRFWARWFWKH